MHLIKKMTPVASWACYAALVIVVALTISATLVTVAQPRKPRALPTHASTTPPILRIINLDKDAERYATVVNDLADVGWELRRIPGVAHKLGKEGCRRAHVRANEDALRGAEPYYVICEDDIRPIVSAEVIREVMINAMRIDAHLVLFECAANLERKIRLWTSPHANFYRITGGGNNAGCYMCSHSFGRVLTDHLKRTPNKHVDHSWQALWRSHAVYLSCPQLFVQRAGASNQSNVDYRDEAAPLDWSKVCVRRDPTQ